MIPPSRLTLILCCCLLLSCNDSARPPLTPSEQPLANSLTGGGAQCGTYQITLPNDVYPVWGCSTQIQALLSGTGNTAALTSATDDWNSTIGMVAGMPRFISTAKPAVVTISGSTATSVNGVWSGTRGGAVNINLAAATGSGSGLPASVALHELGHIMGLGNTWDGGGYRTAGVSTHCTSSATGPGGTYTATTLCQHLVELYLFLYGARPTAPTWSKHIVTGLGVPVNLTVQVGQPRMLEPLLQLDRVNPALCGQSTCELTPPTGVLTWHSTNSQVISVTQNGNGVTLTAGTTGTATVYATMSSPTYELSSLVRDVMVTVPPTPSIATIAAGDGLTVPSGAQVSPRPTVRVLASDGTTPIPGVGVTFASPSGGSTISGGSQLTDANGNATVGSWALPAGGLGSFTMVATVSANVSPNPLTFHATAVLAPPSTFGTSVPSCRVVGSDVRYKLTWQPGQGTTYEIRVATVDDTLQSTLMSQGPASTTSAYTPYYSMTVPPLTHYWWLHELDVNGSPTGMWLPNVMNSQSAADGCVF